MTISIHPDCRTRLIEVVANALRDTEISGRQLPDGDLYTRLADADRVLPQHGEISEDLASYIGEHAVRDFVVHELARDLSNRFEYEADHRQPLAVIEGYEDPVDTAAALISRLETLPWTYELMLPLPEFLGTALVHGTEVGGFPVSEEYRVITFDEEGVARLPENEKPSGFELLLASKSYIPPNRPVLICETQGYVDRFTTTRTVQQFKFRVRSILGVLLALRLAVTGVSNPSSKQQGLKVYRITNGVRQPAPEQSFSPEFSREFQALQLNADYRSWPSPMRRHATRQARRRLQALFSDEEEHESVMRGAQWLFDGYCSGNNLLAFVQTMVAMEILLGEDKRATDLIGLGNLLGNRCAFLIATSREERREVLENFQDAYEIRSRIVHEGKNRLSAGERSALYELRWMCYRVIQEELNLMTDD